MTLIVETGTGDPAAESYCSVADADAYHLSFGNTAWAALAVGDKEVALRKATAYIDQTYVDRWDGYLVTNTQALNWPRTQVRRRNAPTTYGSTTGFMVSYWPYNSVPVAVLRACAGLAFRTGTTGAELAPDQERKTVLERIGPIITHYEDGSSQLTRYTAIERMLGPLLKGGAYNFNVSRA